MGENVYSLAKIVIMAIGCVKNMYIPFKVVIEGFWLSENVLAEQRIPYLCENVPNLPKVAIKVFDCGKAYIALLNVAGKRLFVV